MADPRITLEPGRFDWEGGRGYETPADGGRDLPPGWGNAPDFKDREITPMRSATQSPTHTDMMVTPESIGPPPEPLVDNGASAKVSDPELLRALSMLDIPLERVNLDTGTAMFRGHAITLSTDGIGAITAILAMEVCRTLDEEKDRVLGTMQLETMQSTFSNRWPDVPEVPGPQPEIVPEASGDSGEVQ